MGGWEQNTQLLMCGHVRLEKLSGANFGGACLRGVSCRLWVAETTAQLIGRHGHVIAGS